MYINPLYRVFKNQCHGATRLKNRLKYCIYLLALFVPRTSTSATRKKYSEGLVWDLEMSKNGLNTDVRDCGTSGTRHTPYIYTEYTYKIIYTYFLYSVLKICPSVPQRLEMLINTGLFPWDSLSRTVPQVPHEKIFLQSYTMTGINFSCSGVLMERTILQYQ